VIALGQPLETELSARSAASLALDGTRRDASRGAVA
jgi:hypothetical protein